MLSEKTIKTCLMKRITNKYFADFKAVNVHDDFDDFMVLNFLFDDFYCNSLT